MTADSYTGDTRARERTNGKQLSLASPQRPKRTPPDTRALASLTGEAARLEDVIKGMQRTAKALSLTVQIEVNNLMEVTDLLRFKLHEATLSGVISHPPEDSTPPTMESDMAKISDVYAGDYVSAGELPDGRRIAAVIQSAGVEQVGQDQQKKVVLTLAAPDGRPWPRKMVLNKTNAGILASMYGDDTAPWAGRPIEVWKEPTQFQGRIVPGIKLAAAAPPPLAGNSLAIPVPTPATGNGAGMGVADGHTVPLPGSMPAAPHRELDDEIPF